MSDPDPKIAIITPVYNRRRYTDSFLRMLFAQNYLNFLVYIVDSGSTDGTIELIKGLAHPSVRLLHAPSHFYWTGATNLGVSTALAEGADYILTLNDDVIVPPDYLRQLVSSGMAAAGAIVGSLIFYADRPDTIWGLGAYNDWAGGTFVQTGLAGVAGRRPSSFDRLVAVDYLCGNGTLVPKDVFPQVGLYEQRCLPHYHADTEFTMRAERCGVRRFVASQARIYNRFTDTSDGAFSNKNLKIFSVRSANYAKAIFFIITEYCPPEKRFFNALSYYCRYFRNLPYIMRSRLLRMAAFLYADVASVRTMSGGFFSTRYVDLAVCEDLLLLLQLPPRQFAEAVYFYLLMRAPSEAEVNMFEGAVHRGDGRHQLLLGVLGSEEFAAKRPFAMTAEKRLLLDTGRSTDSINKAQDLLNDEQAAILENLLASGSLPSQRELRAKLSESHAFHRGNNSSVSLPPPPSGGGHVAASGGPVSVYMNVDVLCMAMVDSRAKTGVHRYAASMLDRFIASADIKLQVFKTPGLANEWDLLVAARPDIKQYEIHGLETAEPGIVFYPYFPRTPVDALKERHKLAMTVCDLFPFTKPEWFTAEAASAFTRQARHLLSADHIFCISAFTQSQMKQCFGALYDVTSVTRLGVDPVFGRTQNLQRMISKLVPRHPFLLCVGTIEPRKNLANVLRAFSLVIADPAYDKLELVVAGQKGWGNVPNDIEHDERVRFLGRVDDAQLAELYGDAKCTIFPSLAEGFGFPIVESLSCQTPVITSGLASMVEIGGDACLFVDPLSPEDIARAIRAVLTKDYKPKPTAMRQVTTNYSWANAELDHLEVFQRLAS